MSSINKGGLKPGDRVELLRAPEDKLDRVGKVYTVSMAALNGVVLKISEVIYMTVTNENVKKI